MDPALLPRVQAARDAGEAAAARILDKLYDPKPPARTVGAKRKIDSSVRPLSVRRAEVASSRAAAEVERKQTTLEQLGELQMPGPDAPDGAWRRFAREQSAAATARAALNVARRDDVRKRQAVLLAHEFADEDEKWRDATSEIRDTLAALREREVERRERERQLKRYFELHRAYRFTKPQGIFDGRWTSWPAHDGRGAALVDTEDGPDGEGELVAGWHMVAVSENGVNLLRFEEPMA